MIPKYKWLESKFNPSSSISNLTPSIFSHLQDQGNRHQRRVEAKKKRKNDRRESESHKLGEQQPTL